MRYFIIIIFGLLLVLTIVPLVASSQQQVCERVVQTALAEADQVCTETGRNQACYGHVNLEAQPQSRLEPFKFDEAGDIINVTQLKTLRLSPMNVATGTWGVAMMKLQANLSDDTPSQNVTLVLFGDVEINNAIPIPTEMNITVSSSGNVNVRREPSDSGYVLGTLAPKQVVSAIGRNADSTWLYIDFPNTDEHGWISRRLVDPSGEVANLNVIDPSLLEYGPMQAFYVRTGAENSSCQEAPNDGLLIQTPEGAGEVRLWINEVKIRLGSTVYIQAQPSQEMTISTLEGAAHVEAFGVEQLAVAGTTVSVPLDSHSKPMAPPSAPERYTRDVVDNLPVQNLEEVITVVPPVSPTFTLTPSSTSTEVAPTATATSTETALPTETATKTPTPTDTATRLPTNTPTDTSVPPTDPPTDIPPTDTRVPTEVSTEVEPTSDSGPTSTEESTPEVSQTEEPPTNPTGDNTSPDTPVPAKTPSDESGPTREPTDSNPAPTEEATSDGAQSSSSQSHSASEATDVMNPGGASGSSANSNSGNQSGSVFSQPIGETTPESLP